MIYGTRGKEVEGFFRPFIVGISSAVFFFRFYYYFFFRLTLKRKVLRASLSTEVKQHAEAVPRRFI